MKAKIRPPTDSNSDQDNAWKELLDRHFREFIEFFFPAIAAEINWARKPVFLDKELAKLGPRNVTGKRIVDKLARVWRKTGEKLFVVLHGEVQGPPIADFNQRMFAYNYRIKDRYNAPVVSLGVVTAATKSTTLGRYELELWGCRTVFEFPVVRMSDWRGREADLEASRNPFAMVVLVHLALPRAQKSLQGKYNLKRDLMRRLLQHGFEADYIRSLLRFLDWVIRLPEGLEDKLEAEMVEISEVQKMPYVTSWERRGMRRGEEIGLKRGKLEVVTNLLKMKFGRLNTEILSNVEQLTIKQLDNLAVATLSFTELAELERWLKRRTVKHTVTVG